MNPLLRQWLALTKAPHLGASKARHLLEHFGSITELFEASYPQLQAAGLKKDTIRSVKNPNWKAIQQDLDWSRQDGHHILCWDDDNYPDLLREIHQSPLTLYIAGNPRLLSKRQVSIVGSRKPTHGGLDFASEFAYELATLGLTITSGLALGIDAAAHWGAIQAEGHTIAILGSGLGRIYPKKHIALAKQICENGALVSEFSPTTPPASNHFPQRNRIISGLSLGTLIIEAAPKSGSLITARLAMEQNREVFALPGALQNPLAKGTNSLIQQGAKLVMTVEDILEEIAPDISPPKVSPTPRKNTTNYEALASPAKKLLNCVDYSTTHVDQLVARSGMTAAQVTSMLLNLELHGYISSTTGGYIRVK